MITSRGVGVAVKPPYSVLKRTYEKNNNIMALQEEEKVKVLELVNGLIEGLQGVATSIEAGEDVGLSLLADIAEGATALSEAFAGETIEEERSEEEEELEELLEGIEELEE